MERKQGTQSVCVTDYNNVNKRDDSNREKQINLDKESERGRQEDRKVKRTKKPTEEEKEKDKRKSQTTDRLQHHV